MNPNLIPADDFPEPHMARKDFEVEVKNCRYVQSGVGVKLRRPVVRETQPGELLPDTPDPATGRNGGWYAVGLVIAALFLALGLAQWVRA
jgi:hypothetical protein